jgi:hypothetical protein
MDGLTCRRRRCDERIGTANAGPGPTEPGTGRSGPRAGLLFPMFVLGWLADDSDSTELAASDSDSSSRDLNALSVSQRRGIQVRRRENVTVVRVVGRPGRSFPMPPNSAAEVIMRVKGNRGSHLRLTICNVGDQSGIRFINEIPKNGVAALHFNYKKGVRGQFYIIKKKNAPTGGFAAVARCFFMDRFRVEQHCVYSCINHFSSSNVKIASTKNRLQKQIGK